MRWMALSIIILILSVTAHNANAAGPEKDPGLEKSLTTIRQGFQKTNSCLAIQIQVSINVEYTDTVFTIKEVCESYNKEYLVTRVTALDVANIDYSSIGQFYEDNTAVTIQTKQGKAIAETSTQKYILPPYTVTTNVDRLTSKIIRFGDAETAGKMRKALKDAVKRCDERQAK